MLPLKQIQPTHLCIDQLNTWQKQIDLLPNYADKIARAKTDFSKYNKKGNPTFLEVRSKLREAAPGAERCAYCEDSYGDEVEHIFPKNFYPNRVFDFSNYLPACGPCNSPKGDKFSVFHNGLVVELKRSQKPVEPPSEESLLINPKTENPNVFLSLDVWGTFYFKPRFGLDQTNMTRAEFTIDLLRLNQRDYLVRARRAAYNMYIDMLLLYEIEKRKKVSSDELKKRAKNIFMMPHPTVLIQMLIYSSSIDSLRHYNDDHPELFELFWF